MEDMLLLKVTSPSKLNLISIYSPNEDKPKFLTDLCLTLSTFKTLLYNCQRF